VPGTTTNRGYPYPLGADPIDIAGDIKKLADAIDLDARRTSPIGSYHQIGAVGNECEFWGGGNIYPIGSFTPLTTGKYLVSAVICLRAHLLVPLYFKVQLRSGHTAALGQLTDAWIFTANELMAVPLVWVFDCTAGVSTEIQVAGSMGDGAPTGQAPGYMGLRYAFAQRVQTPSI
jgi:hypothetical protein